MRRPRPFLLAVLVLGVMLAVSARGGSAQAQAGCDEDGIHSSYDVSLAGSPLAYRVTAVRLDGIAPACNGVATVSLKSGGSTIASGSATIAGATLTVPMDNPPLVGAVTGINVQIMGTRATPTPTATATPSPTPTPTPTPSPTPSPTPTSTPGPTPTPTLAAAAAVAPAPPAPATTAVAPAVNAPPRTPTPAASAQPSVTPSPSPSPSATATATRPAPVAPSTSGGPTAPEPPKPEVNEATSDFVADFPSFSELSTSPVTIATNLALSLGLLLLILLAATVFNQTLEENHAGLARVFGRFAGPFGFLVGRSSGGEGGSDFSLARVGLILLVVAGIYSALDSDFGFNTSTAALIISMTVGVGLLTILYEGIQVLIAPRAVGTHGRLEPLPVGIIVAGVSVLLTRITDLHPGIVLGVVAGAIVPTRDAKDQGRLVFVAMMGTLLLSMLALVSVDPLRDYASEHSTTWWAVIPETVAVTLFIGGIEGLLLNMLPLDFMEGHALWAWSKVAWVAVASAVTFLFFHIVVNRTDSYDQVAEETGIQALFIVCLGSLLFAGAFWLACRIWLRGGDEPAHPSPVS